MFTLWCPAHRGANTFLEMLSSSNTNFATKMLVVKHSLSANLKWCSTLCIRTLPREYKPPYVKE